MIKTAQIMLLFVSGLVCAVYGLYLIYHPLAWLFAGGFGVAYALFLAKPEGSQPQ
jgi:hypothetical protein